MPSTPRPRRTWTDLRAAVGTQRLLVDLRAGGGGDHDHRMDALAPLRVRHAEPAVASGRFQ